MSEETPKPGTAVVSWKEKMQEVKARAAAMEAPKGGFLSFKNGRLAYDDTYIPGDKIEVIIVDFMLENTYFPEKFNPNKAASPVCYAIGRDEEDLQPHEEAESPQGGVDGMCASCEHNEWGSDPEGGRGKACKNTRRIAMISADALKADDPVVAVKKSGIVMCKLPVTSVKNFSRVINQIVKVLGEPHFAVTVELSVVPDDGRLFSVNWKVLGQIQGDPLLQALYEKSLQAEKMLNQAYPKNEEDEAPADKPKRKF